MRTSETSGADSINTLHMNTLLWIESGACSGESMAILGLDGPFARGDHNLAQFLEDEHVRLLWHPSLSLESPRQLLNIVDSIVSGNQELTLFVSRGASSMALRERECLTPSTGNRRKT